jgi:CBS domain-containing protein
MAVITSSRKLAGVPCDEVTVGEVMHRGVICCSPEAPLRHVARLMATNHVHAIVVLGDDEEGGLWGVVSDADMLKTIARGELDEHNAGGMAGTPLVTISRSEGFGRAAELMRAHGVTHLLVTSRDRPVGVVSTLDLARAVGDGIADTGR